MKVQPQGAEVCRATCKERKKLWKEELTSLTTLVSAVATLLADITPSEGAETEDGVGRCPKWEHESGVAGLVDLDYWMVLPLILMITTRLTVRVKRYLEEGQKLGDVGPILSRIGSEGFPAGWGGPTASNQVKFNSGRNAVWFGNSCSAARECATEAAFLATQQRIAIT